MWVNCPLNNSNASKKEKDSNAQFCNCKKKGKTDINYSFSVFTIGHTDHCLGAPQADGNRKGLILAECVRAGTKARPLSKSDAVLNAAMETAT